MKHIFLIFFGLTFFSLCVSAQEIRSIWMNRPVVIDGHANEWPQTFRYYDGKTQLEFAIANDSSAIYVCLRIADEQAQRRLFQSGVEVWVDPKGKRAESIGISFPLRRENTGDKKQTRQEEWGKFQKSGVERLKLRVMSERLPLKIKGFLNIKEQTVSADNEYGISAALAWDSLNVLNIEYKMPISLTLQHSFGTKDTQKPIGLGLVEPYLPVANNQKQGKDASEDESSSNMDRWNSNSGIGDDYRNQLENNGMGNRTDNSGWGGSGQREHSHNDTHITFETEVQKIWNKVILALPAK